MADQSLNKITFDALVDKERQKVLLLECDGDFVDVLCSFLALPLGTIIRLARDHSLPSGIGCMSNLYNYIEKMDVQSFRTEECRLMLLSPRNAAESCLKNLKLKIDEPPQFFRCPNVNCSFMKEFSYYNTGRCSCGKLMNSEVKVASVNLDQDGVFVKRRAKFIVSDDLKVMPASTSSMSSLIYGFNDLKSTGQMTFSVGVDEVLNLLFCSLVSETALTDVLLKHKPLTKSSRELFNQKKIYFDSFVAGEGRSDEAKVVSVKLIVSKSKNIVCYAEAREDFVDLLFSFLTVPLGFMPTKVIGLVGCIDQLYRSILCLDDWYLKLVHRRELLVKAKLLPGFGYDNNPLGIKETTCYDVLGVLTTDPSYNLFPQAQIKDPKSHVIRLESCRGFLKEQSMFMVTDDLQIRPISPLLGLYILQCLNVPISDIEERIVNVKADEAFFLLVAAFANGNSALTNAFLRIQNQKNDDPSITLG